VAPVELVEYRGIALRVATDENLIGFFRIVHRTIIAGIQLVFVTSVTCQSSRDPETAGEAPIGCPQKATYSA
jgi:hypothetical protein